MDFVVRTRYNSKQEHILLKSLSIDEFLSECKFTAVYFIVLCEFFGKISDFILHS